MSLEETLDVAFDTECDFCNKELYTGRRMIYLQCIDCAQPTKICLDCFVSGMTYGNHKSDHRVRIRGIMKSLSWSRFWTSDDDVVFLTILLQTHRIDLAAQAVGFTSTLARVHLNYIACSGALYSDISRLPCPLPYIPDLYFLQNKMLGPNRELQPLRKRFIRIPVEKIRPFDFKAYSTLIEVPKYAGAPRQLASGGPNVIKITPGDFALGYFPMRLDLTTPPLGWVDIAVVGIQSLSATFTKEPEPVNYVGRLPQPYRALRYISVGYKERFRRRAQLISLGFGVVAFGYPFVNSQVTQERDVRDRDKDRESFESGWVGVSGVEVEGKKVPLQFAFAASVLKMIPSWATPATIHPGRTTPEISLTGQAVHKKPGPKPAPPPQPLFGYVPSRLWMGSLEYRQIINKMANWERLPEVQPKQNSKTLTEPGTTLQPQGPASLMARDVPGLMFYNYTNLRYSLNIGLSTCTMVTPSPQNASPGIMLCAGAWIIEHFGFSRSAHSLSVILRENVSHLIHSSLGLACVRCGVGQSSIAKLLASHALEHSIILTRNTINQIVPGAVAFMHKQKMLHYTNSKLGEVDVMSDPLLAAFFPNEAFKYPDASEKLIPGGIVSDYTIRSFTRVAEEAFESEQYEVPPAALHAAIVKAYNFHIPGILDHLSSERAAYYRHLIEEREKAIRENKTQGETKNLDGADGLGGSQKAGGASGSSLRRRESYSGYSGCSNYSGYLSPYISLNSSGDVHMGPVNSTSTSAKGKMSKVKANGTMNSYEVQPRQLPDISSKTPSFTFQLSAFIDPQLRSTPKQPSSMPLITNPVFFFVPKTSPILLLIFSLFGAFTESCSEVPAEIKNFGEKFVNPEMAKRVIYGLQSSIHAMSGEDSSMSETPEQKEESDEKSGQDGHKQVVYEQTRTGRWKRNKYLLDVGLIKYSKLSKSRTHYAKILRAINRLGVDSLRAFADKKREFKNSVDNPKKYISTLRLPRSSVFYVDSTAIRKLIDKRLPGVCSRTKRALFGPRICFDGGFQEEEASKGREFLSFEREPSCLPLPEVLFILLSGLKFDSYVKLRECVVSEIIMKWPDEFVPQLPKMPGEKKKCKPKVRRSDGSPDAGVFGKASSGDGGFPDLVSQIVANIERFIAARNSPMKDIQSLPQIPVINRLCPYPGMAEVLSLLIRMELDCHIIKATSFLDYQETSVNRDPSKLPKLPELPGLLSSNPARNPSDLIERVLNGEEFYESSPSPVSLCVPMPNTKRSTGSGCAPKNAEFMESTPFVLGSNDTASDANGFISCMPLPGTVDPLGRNLLRSDGPVPTSFYIRLGDPIPSEPVYTMPPAPKQDPYTTGTSTMTDFTVKRKLSARIEHLGVPYDEPTEQCVECGTYEEENIESSDDSFEQVLTPLSIFNFVSSIDLLSTRAPHIICDFSGMQQTDTVMSLSMKHPMAVEHRIASYSGMSGTLIRQLYQASKAEYGLIRNNYNSDSVISRLILNEDDPLYQGLTLDNGMEYVNEEELLALNHTRKYHGPLNVARPIDRKNYEDENNAECRKECETESAPTTRSTRRRACGRPARSSPPGVTRDKAHKQQVDTSLIEETLDDLVRERRGRRRELIVKISCSGLSVYYQHLIMLNGQIGLKNKYVSEYNENLVSNEVYRSSEITGMFSTLAPDLRRFFKTGVDRY